MIQVVYSVLLIVMILVLYRSGRKLSMDYKLLSLSGILAILVYTLNEGLRFGRGIDYNAYWQAYMDLERGWDSHQDIGYVAIEKIFIYFGLPFQALVLFMSFLFIVGTLLLFKHYKDVVMYALPIWAILTKGQVENMVRWYLAYSFVLIGLALLMDSRKDKKKPFFIISFIGCIIHYAMFPIPFCYYLLLNYKKTLIKPKIAIGVIIAILVFFNTNMMLPFVQFVRWLSVLSDKYTTYGENAEFWLTNNSLGEDTTSIVNIIFLLFLIVVGYERTKYGGRNYIFAYNVFTIGALFYPIGRQIELLGRYDMVFYFFCAIIFGSIIKMTIYGTMNYRSVVTIFSLLFLAGLFFRPVIKPLGDNPMKYMYIWNQEHETPQTMFQMYQEEKYKINHHYETKQERMR